MTKDLSWTDASNLSGCPMCKTKPMWLPEKISNFNDEGNAWMIFLVCTNHYLESTRATKTEVSFDGDRNISESVYREAIEKWESFCKSLEGIV